ncbi:BTAD domain-containing putative transcriptional regulator [Streptomyces sp. NPDC008150]|uniref:BTAD domain-containing putative transcriptional regulator n=1 Tax=Streptomyces sp. NPDC008150 TaxID=3364816 RepID=UPI0036E287B0
MVPVRYRILGTTQALRPDGTTVPVGGARLRALLTVLALRAGHTVPGRLLVDEVWNGGDPPADATGALQALVGRLRRVLGADAVASDDGGYRLAAAPDDVDLHRFERLTGEGMRALADGDAAKAAVVLDDALALWRGPVLADLPDRDAEAARWEARCLDARRARLTAALDLGGAAQSLPELTALCDTDPLDESLQALRLRALRDSGRTAQALAAYEDVRRLLADRLGSDPGPELRYLHAELLSAGDAPPAEPQPRRAPAAVAQPAVPRGNLRARLTSFVGRESDIETIRDDLAGARLVTLLGPGGAGKTRLSQEAAETVDEATARDGVWLAELAPVDDPVDVPEAVLTAVGARETVLYGAGTEAIRAAGDRRDGAVERLVEHCARRRMLLVLDNCEHVIAAAARLVSELLSRCPELTVLATSREPLGVPGELLRPVEPLPEPMALRLFAERGAAARPGFRPDADGETAAAAAEICRRLDGLPLAIELAAARLRMLTPRQIADRLDDRFRLLTTGSRTVLPRQQTLRAVVDWSWDLLTGREREVLAALSVFAGGCDLAAAEAVCGPDALEVLGSLVDKSLVVAGPGESAGELPDSAGEMRYRLLETVNEYAAERLDEAGARPTAERAHLVHYRELARTTDPLLRGPHQRAAIATLRREYENLRGAMRRAVAARDEHEVLVLVHSLTWYWQIHDQRGEAKVWAQDAVGLGPDPFAEPVRPAAPVWERITDSPPPLAGEALWEARRGVHLILLASLDSSPGSWQDPAVRARLSLVSRTYEAGLPQTCRSPGQIWIFSVLFLGRLAQMREVLDAAVGTCRRTPGFEWELASCLQMRANLLANRPESAPAAAADAAESLALYQGIGDAWGIAEALSARAESHEGRGQYAEGAADYEAATVYTEELGAHAQTAALRVRQANALLESGETERGERMLREGLEQSDGPVREAVQIARFFLVQWLGVTGRVAEAREQIDLLKSELGVLAFPIFDVALVGSEAWLEIMDGRPERAVPMALHALSRCDDPLINAVVPELKAVVLLTAATGLVESDPSRAFDAAVCVAVAVKAWPEGHRPGTAERAVLDRARKAVAAALTPARREAATARGGLLGTEEAAALLGGPTGAGPDATDGAR